MTTVIPSAGRSFQQDYEKTTMDYKQLVFINEEPYIYIYDLACLYGLNVVFDSGNNQVRLYRKKENDSFRKTPHKIKLI